MMGIVDILMYEILYRTIIKYTIDVEYYRQQRESGRSDGCVRFLFQWRTVYQEMQEAEMRTHERSSQQEPTGVRLQRDIEIQSVEKVNRGLYGNS